jgi:hypothetical protein
LIEWSYCMRDGQLIARQLLWKKYTSFFSQWNTDSNLLSRGAML